jgi:hypothetical protein
MERGREYAIASKSPTVWSTSDEFNKQGRGYAGTVLLYLQLLSRFCSLPVSYLLGFILFSYFLSYCHIPSFHWLSVSVCVEAAKSPKWLTTGRQTGVWWLAGAGVSLSITTSYRPAPVSPHSTSTEGYWSAWKAGAWSWQPTPIHSMRWKRVELYFHARIRLNSVSLCYAARTQASSATFFFTGHEVLWPLQQVVHAASMPCPAGSILLLLCSCVLL